MATKRLKLIGIIGSASDEDLRQIEGTISDELGRRMSIRIQENAQNRAACHEYGHLWNSTKNCSRCGVLRKSLF